MPSNAAKEWSGTLKELEDKRDKLKRQIRRCLNEHKKFDKQDPDTVERQRRSQQTLDTLNKAFDKVDQFLKTAAPRMGQGKRPKEVKSNITDNQSGKMTTSKGTIQGYNGVATVDRKHQIIIDAQAFGEGQEHHTLKPVLENIKVRYQRLGIRKDVYTGRYKVTVTADTGFANEQNMQYLHNNKIDAYIPDNQFRSRDPKFFDQKEKYGKRHQEKPKSARRNVIPATEFKFDPTAMTCYCPAGEKLSFRGERLSESGQSKAFFEGRLLQCRYCNLKHECMENPEAANHRKGAGRQVSFTINDKRKPTYTDWMTNLSGTNWYVSPERASIRDDASNPEWTVIMVSTFIVTECRQWSQSLPI